MPHKEEHFFVKSKFKEKQKIRKVKFAKGRQCGKAALDYVKIFFGTSVNHCYVYLVMKGLTLVERIFWLILILVSTTVCALIAKQNISRFLNNNSYMGIERNYFEWNTSLPSITVCPLERLSTLRFDTYCSNHKIDGTRKDELWLFLESLANSTYHNFQNIADLPTIDLTLDELGVKPRDYMELIYNLTGDHTYLSVNRIRAFENGRDIHTRQVLTEYGLCYMTNNLLDEKYTSKYLIFGEYPEINQFEEMMRVMPLLQSSYTDPDGKYALSGFQTAIDVFYHTQYEVMKLDQNYGFLDKALVMIFTTNEITVESHLEKHASVQQRNCRFNHESNLTHFPVYTENLCQQECRINLVYNKCGCIPHFYPNRIEKPKPVCNYHILKECFPKFTGYFLKLYQENPKNPSKSIFFPCDCMQTCMSALYDVKLTSTGKVTFEDFNSIIVKIPKWPTIRYKRQLIFSTTDLLVSLGGTAGFFIGFSVLGGIQTIYFFTMRLLFHLLGYKISA